MIKLDYSQHKCPYPVVETRKQIIANPGEQLEILVGSLGAKGRNKTSPGRICPGLPRHHFPSVLTKPHFSGEERALSEGRSQQLVAVGVDGTRFRVSSTRPLDRTDPGHPRLAPL